VPCSILEAASPAATGRAQGRHSRQAELRPEFPQPLGGRRPAGQFPQAEQLFSAAIGRQARSGDQGWVRPRPSAPVSRQHLGAAATTHRRRGPLRPAGQPETSAQLPAGGRINWLTHPMPVAGRQSDWAPVAGGTADSCNSLAPLVIKAFVARCRSDQSLKPTETSTVLNQGALGCLMNRRDPRFVANCHSRRFPPSVNPRMIRAVTMDHQLPVFGAWLSRPGRTAD